MVYDEIFELISNFLVDQEIVEPSEILIEDEVPTPNNNFFVRFVWNFGSTDAFSNKDFQETAQLTLEFFERKNDEVNTAFDSVIQARDLIKRNFSLIRFPELYQYAVMNNISLIKNTFDSNWESYSLTLSFRIYN